MRLRVVPGPSSHLLTARAVPLPAVGAVHKPAVVTAIRDHRGLMTCAAGTHAPSASACVYSGKS